MLATVTFGPFAVGHFSIFTNDAQTNGFPVRSSGYKKLDEELFNKYIVII